MAAGLSICDNDDNKGSTATACSFRAALATFLRTGDISLANAPTSGRISSSNNFTDLFKSKIWSFGNLLIHVLKPLLLFVCTKPSS
jgi:hypothetical protein